LGVRHSTRQIAVQALFALDANPEAGVDTAVEAALIEAEGKRADTKRLSEVVHGVWGKLAEIDDLIEEISQNWKLTRMDRVDRSILRLGVFELVAEQAVPAPVVISEAVELAKEFGSPDSPSFINGLLDRVAREKRLGEVRER
jgi:N utilization substance protein B